MRVFVIVNGGQSRLRTLSVLTACEYRGCLTQQRISLTVLRLFSRAPRCYTHSGVTL